jgi:hypothetical protein
MVVPGKTCFAYYVHLNFELIPSMTKFSCRGDPDPEQNPNLDRHHNRKSDLDRYQSVVDPQHRKVSIFLCISSRISRKYWYDQIPVLLKII